MLISIFSKNAEQLLLFKVESSDGRGSWGAVHFACSQVHVKPKEEALVFAIRPLMKERNASLYLFRDGDIVITFHGIHSSVIKALCETLYTHFNLSPALALDHYFDSQAHNEELRALCKRKLAQDIPVSQPEPVVVPVVIAAPSQEQLLRFNEAAKERQHRKHLEILIVEDERFYANLLAGLLDRTSKIHVAKNAQEAFDLYLQHAPDIAFSDVEMPDINGHELAVALRKIDTDAYIVMVTGNSYPDIARAKRNGTKGFVLKPYSKQQIYESVEKYMQERRAKP